MHTLYGSRGSGSAAVEALLQELNQPFHNELLEKEADGQFPSWFRAISPRAQVPVLKLPDGSLMTESAAMMIYLADVFPEAKLAPAPTAPERAHYLRVLLFLASSIYSDALRVYYPDRFTTDLQGADHAKAAAERDMWRDFSILSAGLGKAQWFTGTFSGADIYAATLISWCGDFDRLARDEPALFAHYTRVKARPLSGAVFEKHGL
jgi:glutathione S-transferase